MERASNKVFLAALAILLIGSADPTTNYSEEFESPPEVDLIDRIRADGWNFQSSGGGTLITDEAISGSLGQFICISRDNRNGQSYLQRTFLGWNGSYKVTALVRAVDVQSGSRWKGGQFQAMIKDEGKEVAWPSEQFENSFEWQTMTFVVYDVEPRQQIVLRFGLQEGKGKACIDHIAIEKFE